MIIRTLKIKVEENIETGIKEVQVKSGKRIQE